MKRFGLQGKLRAKKGKAEELTEILIEASKLVSDLPGCHLYLVGIDKNDRDSICITEVWDSKEDHDSSLKIDEVRQLITKAIPLIDGAPEKGIELEVVYGIQGN